MRDQRGPHHPIPSPTDRRHNRDPGQTRVGQEAPYRVPRPGPKQSSGYNITQGYQNHILRKRVFIQTFMFKRKPTYISENAIRQWVSAEILATKGEMWGWALCMFRELVKEVKECKKGRTTICVVAGVLNRLLDLYFPHSTHPTQKAAAQREDDLRKAKENERNRFNGPNYLILHRSPVCIVDEAGPSNRTKPVPNTTNLLPTPEPTIQPCKLEKLQILIFL